MPWEEKRLLSHSAGSIDGGAAMEAVAALMEEPRFARALEEAGIEIHRFPAFRQLAVQHHSDISGIRFTPPHDHLGTVDDAPHQPSCGHPVDSRGRRGLERRFIPQLGYGCLPPPIWSIPQAALWFA